jgi:hypothetical protein
MLSTLLLTLTLTPRSTMRCISASSTSRGRRYFGMPKAHHAAGSGPASCTVTCMAEPAQVVGRRHARRAGADDQHVLARWLLAGGELPARLIASSPRKRSTELMPTGASSLAAVAGAFAGVVADAAHDGREGVVLGQVRQAAS